MVPKLVGVRCVCVGGGGVTASSPTLKEKKLKERKTNVVSEPSPPRAAQVTSRQSSKEAERERRETVKRHSVTQKKWLEKCCV